MTKIVEVSAKEVKDGSWLDRYKAEWARGNVAIATVKPEHVVDSLLRDTIDGMIENNGTYQRGDTAAIRSNSVSVDMASVVAAALEDRGIRSVIYLNIGNVGSQLTELMQTVYGSMDLRKADPNRLSGMVASYKEILEPINKNGKGHIIYLYPTQSSPDQKDVPAYNLLKRISDRMIIPQAELFDQGKVKSGDIWFTPTKLDVERLNEFLQPEQHWSFKEWRRVALAAMRESPERQFLDAMELESIRMLIYASNHGGRIRYTHPDGTDLIFRVDERPVILDDGRIGDTTLGLTTSCESIFTNQPSAEGFVAPIENSVNGVRRHTVPMRTNYGVIQPPYEIHIKHGKVQEVKAKDRLSKKILKEYLGLQPFYPRKMNAREELAFRMRGIVAEFAIAGFNSVLKKYIDAGRLPPVLGNDLFVEKLGNHGAYGNNDNIGGRTPHIYRGYFVPHTDFVGLPGGRIEYVG